ncbi:unnamed protein product [Blepharisma stoltei]|uniref:Uncharacterized protein n=1 Tax=Blepharisma stoltei TaxID=1481888 RepID=A0AAU9IFX5_9CILI|nr:unnamed protein product [Blepharisma stoltei]
MGDQPQNMQSLYRLQSKDSDISDSTKPSWFNYWFIRPFTEGFRFGIGYFFVIAILGPKIHRLMRNP